MSRAPRDAAPSPREEALKAIEHVEEMLARPSMTGLEKKLALGALEHARVNVQQIQETKRPRRVKPAAEEEHHG
jgi:hypothetical protein